MARARRSDSDPRAAVDLVRQLGAALTDFGLAEVEVSIGELRVRLQRRLPASPATPLTAVPAPTASVGVDRPVVSEVVATSLITVEAPMVGTFYRASSPGAEPYVKEGDVVKEGQILCIIEAMKLMNEIESKASGRVVKIHLENGNPVEFGQPLFAIDPHG
jgi:acetyl-CoA carboxylase biotin carboxyl carrier protein